MANTRFSPPNSFLNPLSYELNDDIAVGYIDLLLNLDNTKKNTDLEHMMRLPSHLMKNL